MVYTAIALVAAISLAAGVFAWLTERPEKRTYMYETEDGERYNPFEFQSDTDFDYEFTDSVD